MESDTAVIESESAESAESAVRRGQNWFVTLLWFIFVGSWLSALWSLIAWLCLISVVGVSLGHIMLNRLPQLAVLQPPLRLPTDPQPAQRFWLWRAVYFVVVGWWLSFLWLLTAWLCSLTLIGLPLAIGLWNRTPAITTLARYGED